MIKISSLYSLECVKDFYVFDPDTLEVKNERTGLVKTVSVNKRGYPVVYLERKNRKHAMNVPMHKIVALALINNGPYELIEHLDDNKLDYRPQNLAFSNQRTNALRAFDNRKKVVSSRTFDVWLANGKKYSGTMRKVSHDSGVPLGTLYDNLLYGVPTAPSRKKKNSPQVLSIVETGQQTIERRKSERIE